MSIQDRLFAPSSAARERLVALRREFHQFAELSWQERRTSQRVREELTSMGLEPRVVSETGVVAVIDGSRPGRTVLLRADLDALPIQEENELPWRSQHDGVMHACGHDGHTAILIEVARSLLAHRDRLAGRIVLVFQPAEEGTGGALSMLDSGVFEEWNPTACGGLHLWSGLETGVVAITDGPFMASTDEFEIVLQGRGGHGALPHEARDPVVAAAALVQALQTLVSRSTDPEDTAVLTVGRLHAGHAFNVIPDTANLGGTVRTYSKSVQTMIEAGIRRIADGIAAAHGMEARVRYETITIATVNDPRWCDVARQAAHDMAGVELAAPGFRTLAGEDFSYFLDRIPGVFFFVGSGNEAKGTTYPHHHPRFDLDEDALALGVEMLAEYGFRAAAS